MPPRCDADDRVYLWPRGLTFGQSDESWSRLAGGALCYHSFEILIRNVTGSVYSFSAGPEAVKEWMSGLSDPISERINGLLLAIESPRVPMLNLDWKRPNLMGILNVTPDSFSDGGRYLDRKDAIKHGHVLCASGARIIDVGGESTRPGAKPISSKQELDRVLPIVEGLRDLPVPLSIDTRQAAVMSAALENGVSMINDISALSADPDSLAVASKSDAPIVLMHCLGDPRTMQQSPVYSDVVLDVFDYLESRIHTCMDAGISRARIIVDPGIGFGKTLEHNVELLQKLSLFHGLGCPLLVGMSRKNFIAQLDRGQPTNHRLVGSIAASLWALSQGVQILRVHDVQETLEAINIWLPLQFGFREPEYAK